MRSGWKTTSLGITFVLELRLRSESFLCSSLLFLRYPLGDKTKRLIETSLIVHLKIRQKINTISPRIVWALPLIIARLLGHDEEEEGDGDEGVDENDEPVHER